MSDQQEVKPKSPQRILEDQIWQLNWSIGCAAQEVEHLERQLFEANNARTKAIQDLVSFHRANGIQLDRIPFQIPAANHDYLLEFQDADHGDYSIVPLHTNSSLAASIIQKQEAAK